jgi:hypothetical protein
MNQTAKCLIYNLGHTEPRGINVSFETALSSEIQRRVVRWKSADVSEEHITSIFRVQKLAKQETSVEQVAMSVYFQRLHGVIPQKTELFTTTSAKT